jgi:hypothetical protein
MTIRYRQTRLRDRRIGFLWFRTWQLAHSFEQFQASIRCHDGSISIPKLPEILGKHGKEVKKSMADAPKSTIEATDAIKTAWKKYAADATFAGMTEAEYEAKVKPSYDIRGQIADLENQVAQLIRDRDAADAVTDKTNQSVIKGIVGDVNYGDDSDLYGACGYVRKSDRKTGLTRKSNTAKAAVAK